MGFSRDEMWRYVKKGAKKVKKGARIAAKKVFPCGPNLSRPPDENGPFDVRPPRPPRPPQPPQPPQPPRPVRPDPRVRPPRPARSLYDEDEDMPLAVVRARLLAGNNVQQDDSPASSQESCSPVIPLLVDPPASPQETDSQMGSPRSPPQQIHDVEARPSRRIPRATDPYTTELLDKATVALAKEADYQQRLYNYQKRVAKWEESENKRERKWSERERQYREEGRPSDGQGWSNEKMTPLVFLFRNTMLTLANALAEEDIRMARLQKEREDRENELEARRRMSPEELARRRTDERQWGVSYADQWEDDDETVWQRRIDRGNERRRAQVDRRWKEEEEREEVERLSPTKLPAVQEPAEFV